MNAERASDLLASCEGKRIAVLGDLMLDRYIGGKASRISQEAPVPVVAVGDTHEVPGGAANVVRNLVAFGANPSVFGLVGADAAGARLRKILGEMGAELDGIVESPARRTTEKTRVLANRQQVVRIDTEDTHEASAEEAHEISVALGSAIERDEVDAVIIEDYAKGLITAQLVSDVLGQANAAGLPVLLDPHPAHPTLASGVTAMTPNRAEAFQLAGLFEWQPTSDPTQDESLANAARLLAQRWGVQYLLITLGPQGMILFRDGVQPSHFETRAREVFDVSGAGDTVIATLTLALASGAAIEDAAELANHAAGVVVGKMGTAVVTPDELRASFRT